MTIIFFLILIFIDMNTSKLALLFFLIIKSSFCFLQNDPVLDSLIKMEAKKLYDKGKFPTPGSLDWVRTTYYYKKDSTHLAQLKSKIVTAPKADVLHNITQWLDNVILNTFRTDTFFHRTMDLFYEYDQQAAFEFCSENMTIRLYPIGYMYQEELKPYDLEFHPFLRFLYEHYPLAQVLTEIASKTNIEEDENYQYVYINVGYIKRKICQRDSMCMQKIQDYLRGYFNMNKDMEANQRFIQGLTAQFLFPHKIAEEGYQKAMKRKKKKE